MSKLMARRKRLVDSMMRDAIYEGALEVLEEFGLNGATMDRVAAAAGVAKGSLYNYFHSKDELLTFVHERTVQPLEETIQQIATTHQTAAEIIESMAHHWRRYVVEHRAAFQILIRNSNTEGILEEASTRTEQAMRDLIRKIILQGIEAGEFRPIQAQYVSEMILAAAKGLLEAEFAEKNPRSDEETIGTLIGVFLHGLCAHP
ncbi:MAG: TetR/AcrR family transcriptional regulator [Pirellulales bacterium]|nr:TetR/AcrR family transcriptional regulator [Pirellulales bacterium]